MSLETKMRDVREPEYDEHALRRMRRRGITREQVEHVLESFDEIRKARGIGGTTPAADIVSGWLPDGRRLEVYIDPDTDLEHEAAYVRTAAWK